MKRIFCNLVLPVMLFVLFLFAISQYALAGKNISERNDNYELFFEENFNGNIVDTASWNKIKRQPYSWSKYMSENNTLYEQKKGRLRLFARYNDGLEPHDTATYITGGVSTQNKILMGYGKVEVRARIKGSKGTWPAIWLLRAEPDKVWPNPLYAELDILESEDRWIARQSAHSYYSMHLKKTGDSHHTCQRVDTEKYNIYAVEILPDMVIFSINNKETFRYPKQEGESIGQYPFGTEYYLLLDMQVGASWVPKPDPSTYPAHMDIDWVKMYKLKE